MPCMLYVLNEYLKLKYIDSKFLWHIHSIIKQGMSLKLSLFSSYTLMWDGNPFSICFHLKLSAE